MKEIYIGLLGILAVVTVGTTLFYGLTARFWVYPQGRRLMTVLSSMSSLALFAAVARIVDFPDPSWGIGAILVLTMIAAMVHMWSTMYTDWRAAGARVDTHHKKETPQ